MNLPRARTHGLLKTDLAEEVVVYDPERKRAHSLSRIAVAAWKHCDGLTSIANIQRLVAAEVEHPVDEATVLLALHQLRKAHLVGPFSFGSAQGDALSRRAALKRGARLGVAALATPLVVSMAVPAAAAAASAGSGFCAPGCASPPNVCCKSADGSVNICASPTSRCCSAQTDARICGGPLETCCANGTTAVCCSCTGPTGPACQCCPLPDTSTFPSQCCPLDAFCCSSLPSASIKITICCGAQVPVCGHDTSGLPTCNP
jgi:Coenzyme PQQ synthesis protein D (PqqD)